MSWRPRNETPADLEREAAAAAVISQRWACEVQKLSEGLYGLDWALFRDDVLIGWAEFKCRSERFPELLLSAAKWETGCRLSFMYQVPFCLVVRWPDGLYHFTTRGTRPFKVAPRGSSRGQNGDKEPCVLIPTDEFKRITD